MINKIVNWLIVISVVGIIVAIVTFIANILRNLFFIGNQSYIAEIVSNISKYNGLLVVFSIITIYLLTAFMLSDCRNRVWGNPFFEDVWKRILVSLPIVGMISYQMIVINEIDFLTQYKLVRNKFFLKCIYRTSFVGTISCFAIMLLIVLLVRDVSLLKFLFALEIILMYMVSAATLILYQLSVIDAVRRPQQEWDNIDFLSLINPWAWIFGLRKYYLNYLLPSAS